MIDRERLIRRAILNLLSQLVYDGGRNMMEIKDFVIKFCESSLDPLPTFNEVFDQVEILHNKGILDYTAKAGFAKRYFIK